MDECRRGLSVDHREAIMVTPAGEARAVKRIESGMEKHVRFSSGAKQGAAEDRRDRCFPNHLNEFFQEM
jgi:hypothetical protein